MALFLLGSGLSRIREPGMNSLWLFVSGAGTIHVAASNGDRIHGSEFVGFGMAWFVQAEFAAAR